MLRLLMPRKYHSPPPPANDHGAYQSALGATADGRYTATTGTGGGSSYGTIGGSSIANAAISGGDWMKLLSILAAGGLVIFGACWTLITRTDDRITRLEGKVDAGFERMSASIDRVNSSVSDLRVEVARARPVPANDAK